MRRPLILIATSSIALLLGACGSEGTSVPAAGSLTASQGAEIFSTHCAGCHTIAAAGTQGSGERALRTQGPNFDQRVESYDEALFAIRNGGFSGAIMPQNIVVGEDASRVAEFVAKYSGTDVEDQPRPTAAPDSETGESNASPNEVEGIGNGVPDGGQGGSGSGQGGNGGPGNSGSGSGSGSGGK